MNNIEKIVEALPAQFRRFAKEGYFVSRVMVERSDDVYLVVDFQRPMTYDEKEFKEYSVELVNSFLKVKKWYI